MTTETSKTLKDTLGGLGFCPPDQVSSLPPRKPKPIDPRQLLAAMGVPPVYRHCMMSTFNTSFCPKFESLLADINERRWLVFTGEHSRCGKTHLAIAALARSWLKAGGSTFDLDRYRFLSGRQFGVELDMAGIRMEEVFESAVRNANGERYRAIVFDEITRVPERSKDRIEAIIDDLYSHRQQLIATSNLTQQAFLDYYDPSIIARISERGVIVSADWRQYGD
jgi:hypothetical protein